RSKYSAVDAESILTKLGVRGRPVSAVNSILPIDVDAAKSESLTIALEEGLVRKGTVVGPDAKPIEGVYAAGLGGGPLSPMKSSEFTVAGLGTTSKQLLLFMDAEKKLGALQPVAGRESDSLTVKLQPLGSVSGEIRRDDKGPLGKLQVTAIP